MSVVTFKALIDGVHFDPKKGAVKIVLIGASHVSLDQLTTLSPNDESIHVILQSEQTTFDPTPPGEEDEGELEEHDEGDMEKDKDKNKDKEPT